MAFSPKVVIVVEYHVGWGMSLWTPFIQDGRDGMAGGSDGQAPLQPLINATSPMEWLGFGVFVVLFLFIILLMIRARVINPVKHRAGPKKAVFEPAGDDADITFDEVEFHPAPRPDHDEPASTHDDEDHGASSAMDEALQPEPDPFDAAHEENLDDDGGDELFPPQASEQKKSHSPFVGLFSSKERKQETHDDQAQDEPIEAQFDEVGGSFDDHDHHDDNAALDEQHDQAELTVMPTQSVDSFRSLDDDVEARRRQAEYDERERLYEEIRLQNERDAANASSQLQEERNRAYQEARDEALRESEFERRKSEAALEQRLRSLASVEQKLSEKADNLGTGAQVAHERLSLSIDQRFADLSAELNQRLDEAATAAAMSAHDAARTDPSIGDLADYVGREVGSLRMAMQEAFQGLSQRIDNLNAISKNAAQLHTQLADVNRLLTQQTQSVPAANNIPLAGIIRRILPAAHYSFETTLSTGVSVDCAVRPTGHGTPISIDDNYPTKAFEHYLRARAASGESAQAANEYRHTLLRHIINVSKKQIVPGETAAAAMIFAPSDTILNDLHANFPDLVQDSYRAKVWIVSPTSLMATMDTMSALAEETSTNITRAAEDTIAAEIDRLRAFVAKADEDGADYLQKTVVDLGIQTDDQNSPAQPTFEPTTIVESVDAPPPQRTPADEALERLEREEALAEQAEAEEDKDPPNNRPPFPLR